MALPLVFLLFCELEYGRPSLNPSHSAHGPGLGTYSSGQLLHSDLLQYPISVLKYMTFCPGIQTLHSMYNLQLRSCKDAVMVKTLCSKTSPLSHLVHGPMAHLQDTYMQADITKEPIQATSNSTLVSCPQKDAEQARRAVIIIIHLYCYTASLSTVVTAQATMQKYMQYKKVFNTQEQTH